VNRTINEVKVELPGIEMRAGERFWDLVAGVEVKSAGTTIRPRGIGCLVAARPAALGDGLAEFLERQRKTDQNANWDASFPTSVQTRLQRTPLTQKYSRRQLPVGMAAIPGGPFHFDVQFRIRECGWYESTQDLIKNFSKLHSMISRARDVVLAPYAMDRTPVTNALFAEFLKASGYQPKARTNFLKHWRNGAPPQGKENHPVVFVDLEDARAFAQWAGKRLPTEEEWQFAAQGADERKFPWGNEVPKPNDDRCNGFGPDTTPVKQFPAGRSPFGLYDMCGNTWEWTGSERTDGVNRFAILRSGSHYQADGSIWYMDGGPREVSFGSKCLLTWPGIDRCATVGFRCAVDLER